MSEPVKARRTLLRCSSCGKRAALQRWSFLRGHWYVRPYSCTGGDYWNVTTTETCHVDCPNCGTRIYLYNHPERDKITAVVGRIPYRADSIFGQVEESYAR